MDLELRGRIGLVTGASVGIGRGIAQVLAAEGVQLALVARRGHLLKELAEEIAGSGAARPLVLALDLTAPDAPACVRDEVLGAFGRLDILVNNAGGSRALSLDAPDAEWEKNLAINFTAARRLTHAFLPAMQQQRWGRIINLSGTSEPKSLNAATSSKAALHGWAKGLSGEVGRDGITVNSVAPGRITSEQIVQRVHPTAEDRERFAAAHIPVGYFGEPHDIACLVAFLASPKARYITGEIIHVDGGLRRFAF